MKYADTPDCVMTDLAEGLNGGADDRSVMEAWSWLRKNEPEKAETMRKGLLFDASLDRIAREDVKKLYEDRSGIMKMSATGLEEFAGCPFAFFLDHGLEIDVERESAIDPMNAGSVYHECLMRVSRRLSERDVPVTGKDSPWMKISAEELDTMVGETIDDIMDSEQDGIFRKGPYEQYCSRRMRESCSDSARAMVSQVRRSGIEKMMCEVPFDTGGKEDMLEPVRIDTPKGEVIIRGKIDRLDISPDGYAKVIDYKSSERTIDREKILEGLDLQLVLYIQVAGENGYIPAGTFYYHIHEPGIKEDRGRRAGFDEKLERSLAADYRMPGLVVNDEKAISFIDSSGAEGPSEVARAISRKKNGELKAVSGLVTREEFDGILAGARAKMEEMAAAILDGTISIDPAWSSGTDNACRYCKYKGICKFDTEIPGCGFRKIGKSEGDS